MCDLHAFLQHFCPCFINMSSFCVFSITMGFPVWYILSQEQNVSTIFLGKVWNTCLLTACTKCMHQNIKFLLGPQKIIVKQTKCKRAFWPFSLYQKGSWHLTILNFPALPSSTPPPKCGLPPSTVCLYLQSSPDHWTLSISSFCATWDI